MEGRGCAVAEEELAGGGGAAGGGAATRCKALGARKVAVLGAREVVDGMAARLEVRGCESDCLCLPVSVIAARMPETAAHAGACAAA